MRKLVPLVLLGVLTVGALAAIYVAGHAQHQYTPGLAPVTASSSGPALSGPPPLLAQAEAATAKAGRVDFIFNSSSTGPNGVTTSQGLGGIDFTRGSSEDLVTTTQPDVTSTPVGQHTTLLTVSSQMIHTPAGTFEQSKPASASNAQGWSKVSELLTTGPFSAEPLSDAGGAFFALAQIPSTAHITKVGSSTLFGVPVTSYKVAAQESVCGIDRGKGKSALASIVTFTLDAQHRIRSVGSREFVKITDPRATPKVLIVGTTSSLVFSQFGHSPFIVAPKAFVGQAGKTQTLQPGAQAGCSGSVGWVAYAPVGVGATAVGAS